MPSFRGSCTDGSRRTYDTLSAGQGVGGADTCSSRTCMPEWSTPGFLQSHQRMRSSPVCQSLLSLWRKLCWLRIVLHRKMVTRSMIIRKFLHFHGQLCGAFTGCCPIIGFSIAAVQWANSIGKDTAYRYCGWAINDHLLLCGTGFIGYLRFRC